MQHDHGNGKGGGWRDWIWMVLCCLPMISTIVLAALGVSAVRMVVRNHSPLYFMPPLPGTPWTPAPSLAR